MEETLKLKKIESFIVVDRRKYDEKYGGYKTVQSGHVVKFETEELGEGKRRIDFHLDTGYTVMLTVKKE